MENTLLWSNSQIREATQEARGGGGLGPSTEAKCSEGPGRRTYFSHKAKDLQKDWLGWDARERRVKDPLESCSSISDPGKTSEWVC